MAKRSIRAAQAARAAHAAQEGDVNALYVLLGEDPFVLDKMDRVPFLETPLHIASSAGRTQFAIEIMILKPSLARKLNQNGLSPMLLAMKNGHIETVRGLLAMDHDLARVKGREGKTPLHCAAVEGSTDVLAELRSWCPDSIKELTVGRETALHLAVKNDQFEAFEVLVEGLMRSPYEEEVLNMKDKDGKTVLHLATSKRQRQAVELLLSKESDSRRLVEVNTKDANGETCLDIILTAPSEPNSGEIEEILHKAGGLRAKDIPSISPEQAAPQSRIAKFFKLCIGDSKTSRLANYFKLRIDSKTSNETRNALLVVAVLVATATFETGVNPPNPVMDEYRYIPIPGIFTYFNMIGFLVSMLIIYLLTKGYPLRPLLLIAQGSMLCTYMITLFFVASLSSIIVSILVYVLIIMILLFLSRTIKYIKKHRSEDHH